MAGVKFVGKAARALRVELAGKRVQPVLEGLRHDPDAEWRLRTFTRLSPSRVAEGGMATSGREEKGSL